MSVISTEFINECYTKSDYLNVIEAQLAWTTAVECSMTALLDQKLVHSERLTPLQALTSILPQLFQLFFTPKSNPKGINLADLFEVTTEQAFSHPILLTKLFMVFDPFAIQLQRPISQTPLDRMRLAENLLKEQVDKTPLDAKSFSNLNLIARGLTTHLTAAKTAEKRRQAPSYAHTLTTPLTTLAAGALKTSLGISETGNWQVLNGRLLEQLDNPDMETAFHKHFKTASLHTRTARS